MPQGFSYPVEAGERVDVWIPFVPPAGSRIRGNDFGYYLEVVGRLKPDDGGTGPVRDGRDHGAARRRGAQVV